ncbi:MAG: RNA methyltransferase [Bacteroidetes bacterium]|nr:RNA methyltransferase [Bacteroidota bacterium]
MLSKNTIKYITSLKQKKFRDEFRQFVAEGDKLVSELLLSYLKIVEIFAVKEWFSAHNIAGNIKVTEVTAFELERISGLTTPNLVIALLEIPDNEKFETINFDNLILVLDEIKDPGNLGTIIRIADWFGIKDIICSNHTVDIYNPKVVQATMGSIARVIVHYTELTTFLKEIPKNIPVYGTLLSGENIYTQDLTKNGMIIIGNESKGISGELLPLIKTKLLIPSFPENNESRAESLNASIACAIVCAEFKRRVFSC